MKVSRSLKVLLIIPAYNEQDSIVATVRSVQDAGLDYVVVNDGSLDDTAELCRAHGFNMLDLPLNLGIGGAVQAGHKYALEHGYDADIQFDGDGQHDVASIPALLKPIEEGADLVVGSRFISEENTFQSTAARRLGIRWLKGVLKFVVGQDFTDATSGFRACNRRAMELFAGYYPSDYPEPESIAYAVAHGMNVCEVPAIMHERQGGTSSIGGLSALYYMIKVSLAILINHSPKGDKGGL